MTHRQFRGLNHPMQATRSFYFFYYAAAAALIPFLVIYYEQLGFSGRQIGILAALPPLIMLIGAPLWGAAADATNQHKRLLLLAITIALLVVFVYSRVSAFIAIIPIVTLFAFFSAPIMPLFDASTMDWLGDNRHLYGRLRLWGAVGWGASAPLIGWLIERSGVQWAFYGYIILMLGGLAAAWFLPIHEASTPQPFWSNIRVIGGNKQWLLFLAVVFIGGTCLSIISNYLFLYMSDLGASKTLMGLSLTFATISELPILFYSDRLLIRWKARGLLLAAMAAFVVRALAYSLISTPWLFLGVQLLHGPTFAAMWVAGVSYADSLAPKGLGATSQGLFSGVLLGMGGIAGALAGGVLYDALGPVILFRLAATIAFGGAAAFVLVNRNVARQAALPVVAGGEGDERNQ